MKRFLSFFVLILSVFYSWGIDTAMAQIPQGVSASQLPNIQIMAPRSIAEEETFHSLFYREPWRFGPETFESVWYEILTVPQTLASLPNVPVSLDPFWISCALLICLILGLFWALDRLFQRLPQHFLQFLPRHWALWVVRLSKIILMMLGRSILLLLLVFVVHMLWGALAQESRYFPLVLDTLWIFVLYRMTQTLLHEVLIQERTIFVPGISQLDGRRLYWRLNLFLLFSGLYTCGLSALYHLGAAPDIEDLFQFIYLSCLLLFVSSLIAHKERVFDLFPQIDEPVYLRFMDFFKNFYVYVASFTLMLGLLWIAGYHNLASLIFLRSWAVVGLVLGVRLLHRLVRKLMIHYLQVNEDSALLNHSLQALGLLEVLALIHGVFELLGLRQALLDVLSFPIATIGDKSMISPLSLINGILTFALFWLVARIVQAFLEERVFPTRFEADVHQMLEVASFYSLMILGCLMALNIIGLDLSVFAIFAGALAFGVGFGLQGIAKNFASGIILIFTGLVKKGDYITVSGYTGYIQDVSWKKVHLKTPDHVDLIIPTVDLVETTIVNWSYSGKETRVHVPISVAFDSDLNQVKSALIGAAEKHADIMDEPPPNVWLSQFGDSAIHLELLVWIDCTRITKEKLIGELNFLIWQAFQEQGIRIPYPQQDVHLHSTQIKQTE